MEGLGLSESPGQAGDLGPGKGVLEQEGGGGGSLHSRTSGPSVFLLRAGVLLPEPKCPGHSVRQAARWLFAAAPWPGEASRAAQLPELSLPEEAAVFLTVSPPWACLTHGIMPCPHPPHSWRWGARRRLCRRARRTTLCENTGISPDLQSVALGRGLAPAHSHRPPGNLLGFGKPQPQGHSSHYPHERAPSWDTQDQWQAGSGGVLSEQENLDP